MSKKRQEMRHGRPRTAERAVIGYVHPWDQVGAQFHQSLLMLREYDAKNRRRLVGVLDESSGAQITTARNKVVKGFLDYDGYRDVDWLLLIDADMQFPPDILDRLIEAADPQERPIVGGLCFAVMGEHGLEIVPTLFRWDTEQQNFTRVVDYPRDQLVEVAATGMACVLVHRTVFEKIAESYTPPWPWFAETVTGDQWGATLSEDVTFFYRAKLAGFPVFVDTSVKIGHVKPIVIDETLFLATRKPPAEPPAPTYVIIPVKGRQELTESLLKQLEPQKYEQIYLFDNAYGAERYLGPRPDACEYISAGDATIHEMWNKGIDLALEDSGGRCNIAILNNDLNIGPHFLERLAAGIRSDPRILAACPNYDRREFDGPLAIIKSTFKNGGLSGFAFMLRGEIFPAGFPKFDENLRWYFGDDDLMQNIDKVGGVAVMVKDATAEHIGGGSQTASAGTGKRLGTDELREAARADGEYFAKKWAP